MKELVMPISSFSFSGYFLSNFIACYMFYVFF
jgi:hypothetical protein